MGKLFILISDLNNVSSICFSKYVNFSRQHCQKLKNADAGSE
jgi:hypothetical protein